MRYIGFDVRTEIEYLELARRAALEAGEGYQVDEDRYLFVWTVGRRIELWSQVDMGGGSILGLNPHFSGSAVMRVGIVERIPPSYEGTLDGAFYGWLAPDSDERPESGQCPVVFDAPNYSVLDELELPVVCSVQLAAFPQQLEVFPSEDEYFASQANGPRIASEAFIPSGTFSDPAHFVLPVHLPTDNSITKDEIDRA
jgi:hypothetical protein